MRSSFWSLLLLMAPASWACGAADISPERGEPSFGEHRDSASSEEAAIPPAEPVAGAPQPEELPSQPEELPSIEGVLGHQWQCSGEVDSERLQKQLDAAAADFRACFVEPMVEGRIAQVDLQVIARVDRSGAVTDQVVRSSPALLEPTQCAHNVLRGLKLTRPRAGGCFVLDYPLRFRIRH